MSAPVSLSIATVNVRMDGDHDVPVPIPETGHLPRDHQHKRPFESAYRERPWCERRSRMIDCLLSSGPIDIIGFQEVYHNQLMDIATLLGPGYAHVGAGRDDGKEAGEYSPIFYDKSKFELVRWRVFWLSSTPDVPGSRGWDADLPRIAVLLTLTFSSGPLAGQLLHVVNTHYDHRGLQARAESSLLIRKEVASWVQRFEDGASSSASKAPVFLFGDFNSPPDEDGYKFITSSKPLSNGQPSLTFLDSFTHLKARSSSSTRSGLSAPYGPEHTFSDFASPGRANTTRIDFVMLASSKMPSEDAVEGEVSGRGGWQVTRYACLDNWVEEGDATGWSGRWSDHRAVKVVLEKL